MFGDIIKIATRTGAVVAIGAIILAPFLAIRIPNVDYSVFSSVIGKGYSIMNHWVPGFSTLWSFATGIFTFWLAIKTAQLAVSASRIVLTIFK